MKIADYENEIPKYRKRESSTSKAERRADHKHNYETCLLIRENTPHPAKYCTICGKIYDEDYFHSEKNDGYYRMLRDNEIYEKYSKAVYCSDNVTILVKMNKFQHKICTYVL